MYYCETVHHCPLQSEHPDAEVVGHLLHVQALVGEHCFEFPNKKTVNFQKKKKQSLAIFSLPRPAPPADVAVGRASPKMSNPI